MIQSYWKGQIACVSELLIEHECLSGVCFPQFYGMLPKGDEGARATVPEAVPGAPEMNFELAAAGEKEHE